ncbi:dTDP-4-dehydrorhamnose 3,5-epimerase [Raoultella terrigena]|uniref:dTDP-4-dehydrorhamnose 3,5-epimerase n=1 Tax=Raoultella terrigena TaxID=577 RepID=A0A4U9CY43_RAOTE|nr:dTDP-4-dehydrorhamnose 3,5-epimerase [Raoultella terrigena]
MLLLIFVKSHQLLVNGKVFFSLRRIKPNFGSPQASHMVSSCYLKSLIFEYKCTDYYNPINEACLFWNDPDIDIRWPIEEPLLSEKDRQGKRLKELFP